MDQQTHLEAFRQIARNACCPGIYMHAPSKAHVEYDASCARSTPSLFAGCFSEMRYANERRRP
ncbi:MAG TPA: hypothetical protein DEF41_13340 [Desulfovibrio sp.]|nr:hypothetical protein DDE01_21490 [Desulfovibrio desulfuricans]HBW17068.1 hypothetical protein [Desulfovibrio sp.]